MSLTVNYLSGTKFKVTCRKHSIITDQPESEEGTDQGMTPVELLNASLSACTAYYASLFLKRHIQDLAELEVRCTWNYLEEPHRVGVINLTVVPPRVLTKQEKIGLLRSIEHCTIENTLKNTPEIRINIED